MPWEGQRGFSFFFGCECRAERQHPLCVAPPTWKTAISASFFNYTVLNPLALISRKYPASPSSVVCIDEGVARKYNHKNITILVIDLANDG
mmetsp:Transcript_18303/g.41995  ORF Transcript_18303/g.41995 Transcript_18303/m.41995 type:complete len:91 (-) Transcript_18303:83-355(-)